MKQCGECKHLITSIVVDGMCPCEEKDDEKHFANDYYAENCDLFSRVGWGYTSDAKEAIARADKYVKENTQVFKPSGCFITTAIVNILGMKDDCDALQTLRSFRGNILQKNAQYRDLLLRYDTVGPVLARGLIDDENSIQVALDLYNIYIKGCVGYIKRGNIEYAVSLYTEMVERMISRYMITREVVPETIKEKYVQDGGGHGEFKIRQV